MENLQLALTGDKGVTTDLTLFLSASEQDLLVYLGVALLERVEYNRNQFAYKMLIGRLVNAEVALAKLNRQFNHDSRTMKRWAKALTSEDPNFIVRAFAGRGPLPKVIGPMVRFVKMRYLSLKGFVRNFRQIIAREVEECFGETLSRETLRHLFNLARQESAGHAEENVAPSEVSSKVGNTALDSVDEVENDCHSEEITSSNEPRNDKYSPHFLPIKSRSNIAVSSAQTAPYYNGGIDSVIEQSASDANGRDGFYPPSGPNGLPYSNQQPGSQFRAIQHAGQILFSPWLDMFGFQRPHAHGLQSQWIGQILQGAVNIEQSHLICATSLALLTGLVIKDLKSQRIHLGKMADAAAVLDIYRANTRLLPDGPGMGNAFFYDSHTKECSTQLTMLK